MREGLEIIVFVMLQLHKNVHAAEQCAKPLQRTLNIFHACLREVTRHVGKKCCTSGLELLTVWTKQDYRCMCWISHKLVAYLHFGLHALCGDQ